jgi:hypothetical protein
MEQEALLMELCAGLQVWWQGIITTESIYIKKDSERISYDLQADLQADQKDGCFGATLPKQALISTCTQ